MIRVQVKKLCVHSYHMHDKNFTFTIDLPIRITFESDKFCKSLKLPLKTVTYTPRLPEPPRSVRYPVYAFAATGRMNRHDVCISSLDLHLHQPATQPVMRVPMAEKS